VLLKALVSHGRLDAELAAGGDPALDPALDARARRLTRARYRRRLARSVQRLVRDLDRGGDRGASSAVPVRRERLARARGILLSVAGALRDVDPIEARGVAMTLRLMTDARSPLYEGSGEALRRAAEVTLDHLIACSHPWCDLPGAPPLNA
jgi:hypothetical protein